MSNGHDLGGKPGLGPVGPQPEAQEPVFHAEWEKRVFALTLAAGALGRWNIDKSRQARERQHPDAYLRQSYYENWLVGLETLLLETGLLSAAELAAGRAAEAPAPPPGERVLAAAAVGPTLARGAPVDMPIDAPPRFEIGARVGVVRRQPGGHTRVPGYVCGRTGTIHRHHGAHVFPDASAAGVKEGRHLYGVRFAAADLGHVSAAAAVYVDLFEDYLETPP